MKYKFNIFMLCLLVFLILPGSSGTVLADDVQGGQGTSVLLDIVWNGDTAADRPDAIYVELYRTVNGNEQTVEVRKISAQQLKNGTDNTWETVFTNLPGNTWEYAFRVDDVDKIASLYAYSFSESGAGTQTRTFNYTHGTGDTNMTVSVQWDDNNNSRNTRPEQYQVSLFSPSNTDGTPERVITLTSRNAAAGNSSLWTAEVTGLEEDPARYAVSPTNQPDNYQNSAVRGSTDDEYIMTNKLLVETVQDSAQQNAAAAVSSAATSLCYIPAVQNGVLKSGWLNFLVIILIGIVSWLCIQRHRLMVQQARRRNRKR
ncbi:MAG: Cna B-type domain-containing protein [Eubacteriaceae bacterium]